MSVLIGEDFIKRAVRARRCRNIVYQCEAYSLAHEIVALLKDAGKGRITPVPGEVFDPTWIDNGEQPAALWPFLEKLEPAALRDYQAGLRTVRSDEDLLKALQLAPHPFLTRYYYDLPAPWQVLVKDLLADLKAYRTGGCYRFHADRVYPWMKAHINQLQRSKRYRTEQPWQHHTPWPDLPKRHDWVDEQLALLAHRWRDECMNFDRPGIHTQLSAGARSAMIQLARSTVNSPPADIRRPDRAQWNIHVWACLAVRLRGSSDTLSYFCQASDEASWAKPLPLAPTWDPVQRRTIYQTMRPAAEKAAWSAPVGQVILVHNPYNAWEIDRY